MTEKSFGIASLFESKTRIYYEAIFTQYQLGRVVDLFNAVAAGSGVRLGDLRTALSSSLAEACRYQAMFEVAEPVVDPVLVEMAIDSHRAAFSVQFTYGEKDAAFFASLSEKIEVPVLPEAPELLIRLYAIARFAAQVQLTIHEKTRRAEIQVVLQLSKTNDLALAPQPQPVHCYRLAGETAASSHPQGVIHEYVALGDVDYVKLLEPPTADNGTQQQPSDSAKKMLAAACSDAVKAEAKVSGEIDELLKQETTPEEVIEALSKSISPEQMAETIKRNFSPDQIGDLLAKGDPKRLAEAMMGQLPKAQLEKLLSESLSDEAKAELIANADPDASAKLLRSSMDRAELVRVLNEGMSEQEKAQVLVATNPKEAAKLLKEALSEESMTAALQSLSEEEQGKVLSETLSKSEIADLLTENLTAKEKAALVTGADPKAAAKILTKSLSREEVSRLISEDLSDAEKAKALADQYSSEEVVEMLTENLEAADQAKLLAQLDPEESVRMIKASAKPGDLTRALIENLGEQGLAKMLLEGLPEDEVKELIANSFSQEMKAKALSESDPDLVADVIRGNASPEQIAELINGSLTDAQKADILVKGMKEEDLNQLVKGSVNGDGDTDGLGAVLAKGLPEDEFAKLVKGSMPEADLLRAIKGGIDDEQIVDTILAGSSQEEAARLVRKAMNDHEIADALAVSFSKDGIPPEQLTVLSSMALQDPEIQKRLLSAMPAEDLAEAVFKSFSGKDLAELARSQLSDEELMDLMSAGMSKQQLSKVLSEEIPEENYARILAEGLPSQEIARVLMEGLPKEEFATLMAQVAPNAQLAQTLLEASQVKPLELAALAPSKLDEDQFRALMAPNLNTVEAVNILSSVLPPQVAQSIFSGAIPEAEISDTLAAYLPNSEFAEVVTQRLMELQASPEDSSLSQVISGAEGKAGEKPPVRVHSLHGENGSQDENDKTDATEKSSVASADDPVEPPSFARERAALGKNFEAKLAVVQNSVEFYLRRSQDLERRLRVADEAKARLIRKAEVAESALERIFAKPADQALNEVVKAANSGESASKKASAAENAVSEKTSDKKSQEGDTKEEAVEKKKEKAPQFVDLAPANRPDADLRRDREAVLYFQDKNKELESELRQAEAEIKRLNAERANDLIKLSKEKEGGSTPSTEAYGTDPLAAKRDDRVELVEKQTRSPETRTEFVQKAADGKAKKDAAGSEQEATLPIEAKGSAASPPSEAKVDGQSSHATQVLQTKVRDLETQLRKAEDEKAKWIQQYKKERIKAEKAEAGAAAGAPEAEKNVETAAKKEVNSAQENKELNESVEAKSIDESSEQEDQDEIQLHRSRIQELEAKLLAEKKKRISSDAKALEPADSAPYGDGKTAEAATDPETENVAILEKTVSQIDQGMDKVVRKMEDLRASTPDGKARQAIDSLLSDLNAEKIKFNEKSREISNSLRKQEFSFKNKEALLNADATKARVQLDQKQAMIERMKQMMAEVQQKLERTRSDVSQTGNNETQLRVKFEQSQRQIEVLNKEVERLNRQRQIPTQQANVGQAGALIELKGQMEAVNKALLAKKQELEVLKKQSAEKDAKEVEYKRTIHKIQTQLNTLQAQKPAKKAG